jgi:DNA-binding NarL/FixJ family response regulator
MSALTTGLPSDASRASRTRLLIADDHPLILAGVRRTLERNEEIEIVGEATTAAQVLAMVERRRPDVVMLDPKMPGMTGAELVGTLRHGWPDVRVVVLSANCDPSTIDSALLAGASAYVVKNVRPAELPGVIRQVSNGAIFHAPSRPVQFAPTADDGAGELTQRERTILEAISTGKTTAAISRELWVSEHTIKFHLTNIYRKLGVSNRAGAIRHALEHHLVG